MNGHPISPSVASPEPSNLSHFSENDEQEDKVDPELPLHMFHAPSLRHMPSFRGQADKHRLSKLMYTSRCCTAFNIFLVLLSLFTVIYGLAEPQTIFLSFLDLGLTLVLLSFYVIYFLSHDFQWTVWTIYEAYIIFYKYIGSNIYFFFWLFFAQPSEKDPLKNFWWKNNIISVGIFMFSVRFLRFISYLLHQIMGHNVRTSADINLEDFKEQDVPIQQEIELKPNAKEQEKNFY